MWHIKSLIEIEWSHFKISRTAASNKIVVAFWHIFWYSHIHKSTFHLLRWQMVTISVIYSSCWCFLEPQIQVQVRLVKSFILVRNKLYFQIFPGQKFCITFIKWISISSMLPWHIVHGSSYSSQASLFYQVLTMSVLLDRSSWKAATVSIISVTPTPAQLLVSISGLRNVFKF